MLKVLLYSFSMCRHKLYQILLISKNVHHFKFIRGRYAKSILAIIPGLYFLKNVIWFFVGFFASSSFCFAFSALYNEISGMLLSLEL